MGRRDSDIGDRSASAGVIPFERMYYFLRPCLRYLAPIPLWKRRL
jgi:hypothetical protein